MSQDKLDKIQDDVSELKSGQARLEVHVEEMKEDIRYHIRRTDLSEIRIERLEKIEQWLRGATWITLGLGSILLIALKYFKS